MRIIHVYKDYYPVLGGIENHIRVLAEAQVRQHHEVTVLATRPAEPVTGDELNGVRIIRAQRLATLASTPLSWQLVRRLRRLPADVVHLHLPYPPGELAQLLSFRKGPYVITYHADITKPLQKFIMLAWRPFQQTCLRGAARILVTSPVYAATSPYLHKHTARIQSVPLGVDPQLFQPPPAESNETGPLLFTGLLRHYKGLDTLLHALTRLPETVRLRIAGDGPMRGEWQNLACRLGIQHRTEFMGQLADDRLPEVYQSASLFILPSNSRAEAFGTVLLEAMASGLACITTEVGSGTSYVVQHERTGLVIPPRDPVALADAINRLLHDPKRLRLMGQAGRRRVLEEFTRERMVEQIQNIYGRIT